MADVVSINKPVEERESAAKAKAVLIGETLQTLRAAQCIDERDDLNVGSFLDWYDRTIPEVKDIKILAGAMEIELARRRGEHILQEGEQRGRPEKGTQRVLLPSNAVRRQRQKDRVIAAQPEAVANYVEHESKAGRVPSKRGAVRAAQASRPTRVRPKRIRPKSVPTAAATALPFQQHVRAETARHVESVRDTPLTLLEIASRLKVESKLERHRLGRARNYLKRMALLSGVVVTRTGGCYLVTLTEEAGVLETFQRSLHEEFVRVEAELTQKRKVARDGGVKGWRPDNVHTVHQSAALDWIVDWLREAVTKFTKGGALSRFWADAKVQ